LDKGSLHTTVRTVYLTLVLEEIEHAIGADTHRLVAESCLDGVRAHLQRARESGEPPSLTVLEALIKVYGPKEN
jgi:hypothetical protein